MTMVLITHFSLHRGDRAYTLTCPITTPMSVASDFCLRMYAHNPCAIFVNTGPNTSLSSSVSQPAMLVVQ